MAVESKRNTSNSCISDDINDKLNILLDTFKTLKSNQTKIINMQKTTNERIKSIEEKLDQLNHEKEPTDIIETKLNDVEKNVTQEVKAKLDFMEESLTNKLKVQENAVKEKLDQLNHEKEPTDIIETKLNDVEKNVTQEVKTKLDFIEESLTNKLKIQENAVKEKISTYANSVKKNIKDNQLTKQEISAINSSFKELRTDVVKKIDQEKEEAIKATKKLNVCIYNVPESKETSRVKSQEEDVNKLKQILRNKIALNNTDIKTLYRKGEKEENKVRPIIMKFNNPDKRLELLKLRGLKYKEASEEINNNEEDEGDNEGKLHKEASEEINNNEEDNEGKISYIFVHPDRTKLEQEQHRKLVSQLKQRKLKGEKDISIRNGKIIKYLPFRSDTQFNWV